ncbi:capsular polysaccharide synthesis protein [Lacticaseibacillus chiayiensis]|uniref:capsular polysaccharide synthesis protein n=1 Tax=Lacticaseibacillus chiayiensis TaxID=2100821 RepID=UPI003C731404
MSSVEKDSTLDAIRKNLKLMKALKKSFGASIAVNLFCSKLAAHIGGVVKKNAFLKKDQDIFKILDPIVHEVSLAPGRLLPEAPNTVWFFWWQGLDGAPKLVRDNFKRAKRIFFDREVILLTRENFDEFVEIPSSILERVKNNSITLAAFSDILRFALLGKYGGLWMDSTIYLIRYPAILRKNLNFVTLKGTEAQMPDFFYMNPSHYRWSIYFLGFFDDVRYSHFIFKCFLRYWERYDILIDYFLVDYFFALSMKSFKEWNSQVSTVPPSNLMRESLNLKMNSIYDRSLNEEYISKNDLVKFSLRDEPKKKEINGQITLYGFLKRNGRL